MAEPIPLHRVRAERGQPHNLDAESGVLGCCILDGGKETMTRCVEAKLVPESFYHPAHQIIFSVLQDFYREGGLVDEIVIEDRLKTKTVGSLKGREKDPERDKTLLEYIGGEGVIERLGGLIDTTIHAPHWIEIVREKALLRRMIRTCSGVVEKCYKQNDSLESFIGEVEREVFAISQDRVEDTAQPLSKSLTEAERTIHTFLSNKGKTNGISSGFKDLDKMTFGFQPGDMIVLAARPSMGKTSLAMNIAEHAVMDRETPANTLFFSLEMTAESLAMRLLCGRSRVNSRKVREGFLSQEDQKNLYHAGKALKNAPMLIDDSSDMNILEMRAKARRVHASRPIGLIVIDYLQLIKGTDSRMPREQQISEISRGVKALAKELNVPVIVLSQLNRDAEREKRKPRLSDLRESGSIEQDADVVLLLSVKTDGEDKVSVPQASTERELIIAKQRNGPTGEIPLTFNPGLTRFENYAPPPA